MVRFAFRLLGYCFVALGFANLVIDGTVSIASGMLRLSPLGAVLDQTMPDGLAQLHAASDKAFGPAAWTEMASRLLAVPAFATFLLLGFVLVLLGRRPRPSIGFEPLS